MADVDMYFAPCAAGFKCNFCDVTKDVKCNIRKHVRTSHYDRISRRPERANPPEEFIRLGAKQLPDEALPASTSPPGPSRSPTKSRSDPLAPSTSVALPPLTPEEQQLVDQFISKDPTKHANVDGTFSTRSKFICNLCIKENLVRGFEKASQDEVRRHIVEEHLEAIQKEKNKPKIERSVTRNDTRKIPNAFAEPLFGIPPRTQAARPEDAITLRRNPAPVVAPAKTTNVASAVAKRGPAVAPKNPVSSLPPLFSQPQPARVPRPRPRPEPLQPATPPAQAKPSTPASSPEIPRGIPTILAGVIQSPVPKSPVSTPEKPPAFRTTRPLPTTGSAFFPDQTARPSPASNAVNQTPTANTGPQHILLSRQKSQQTMEAQKVSGTPVAKRNSQPNLPRKTSTSSIDAPVNSHPLAASVNQQPKTRDAPPTGASGNTLNEQFSAPVGGASTPARPRLTPLPNPPRDELPTGAPGISLPVAEPPATPLTKAQVNSRADPKAAAEPVIATLIPITAEGLHMLSVATDGRLSVTVKGGACSGNAPAGTVSGQSRELSMKTVSTSTVFPPKKTSALITSADTIVDQASSAPQQNPSKRRRSRSPRVNRPQPVDDRLQSNGWACDETWENPSGADLPVPTDTSGGPVYEYARAGITGTSLNTTAECSDVLSRLDIRVLRKAVVLPVGNLESPVPVVSVLVESDHGYCTAVSRSVDSLELVQAVSSIEDSPIVEVSSVEDSPMVEVETAVVDIETSAEQPNIISQSAKIPAVAGPQVQAVSGQDFVEISLPLKTVGKMSSQSESRTETASATSAPGATAQGHQPLVPEIPLPAHVDSVVALTREMAGINAEAPVIPVVDARLNVAADGLFVCRKCWFGPEPEDVVLDHVIECFGDSASEGGESGYLPEGSDISAVGLNRDEPMDLQISDQNSTREFSPEYQLATASSISSNSPSLPPARTSPNNRSGRSTKKGSGRGQRRTRSRSTSSVTDDEESLWRTDIPGFEFSDDYKKLIIDASNSSGLSVEEMIAFFTPDLMEECRKDVKWVESLGLSGEPKQEPLDEPRANKNMK